MSSHAQRSLAALRVLTRASHLASADDVPRLATAACAELGSVRAVLHVIDYDQRNLVPLVPLDEERPPAQPVEGTLAGRAYTDIAQQVVSDGAETTVLAPVLDGTDRLGVLEAVFPQPEVADELRGTLADLAQQLAELLTIRSVYGDVLERARRPAPMTVAAELQWRLLPPLTFVSQRAAISGVLLPTMDIAGDAFDYARNGDVLHVVLLDAMGHGLEASLVSAVALSALRNARREGRGLVARVMEADEAVARQFGPDRFVTGIIAELDTATGWWTWATCGHPAALLIRGGKVVKTLDQVVSPPIGLGLLAGGPEVGSERLEPGDRLLLYSDGVVEARARNGEFFGAERLVELVARHSADGRAAAEALRRLNLAILDHQEGELQDDATTVLVEWLSEEAQLATPWPEDPPPGA